MLFSVSGFSIPHKKEQEERHQFSSGHKEHFEIQNIDYGSQNLSSQNNGNQASIVHEVPKADRENCLITDILSLHIGLDDPSASPHDLAKLLLGGDDDKSSCYSKFFNPLKSSSNNESRFSFARMEDSEQRSDNAYNFVPAKNIVPQEIEENNVSLKSSIGTSVHVSENSQILDFHHQLSANEASGKLVVAFP